MHGYLRNTDNPNFIFYTLTSPLARHRMRNALFSHTSHFAGRLIVECSILKKTTFEVFYFVLYFNMFHFFILIFLHSISS
jgi:hypothetical protein